MLKQALMKTAMLAASALLLLTTSASQSMADHRHCGFIHACKSSPAAKAQMKKRHIAARAYMHGFVDGYRRANEIYVSHARLHVRRKVVRLAPGANYYDGQIDPWWRNHPHD